MTKVEENKITNDNLNEEPELIKPKRTKDGAKADGERKPSTKELKEKISELEEKLKEYDDKYLRMAAEYDNFRRRSREEREAAYSTAMADTIAELLPILDNLERAASFDGDKVADGLKMISASVKGTLDKLGVEQFGEPGDTFDPNIHNAVMHDEGDEWKEGEIIDVFQKGYKKGNRIIRFAMVRSAN